MTPAEMREVLLEEALWWANQPAHSGSAHPWVTFFEQLPEDDQMLVMLSGMYQDANAFRNREQAVNSRYGTCTAKSFRYCRRVCRYLHDQIKGRLGSWASMRECLLQQPRESGFESGRF